MTDTARDPLNPEVLDEDSFRALLRRRVDDWFASTSEFYAQPVGSEGWRYGLVSYLVQSYTWPQIARLIAERDTLAADLARERMDQAEFDAMHDRAKRAEAKVAAVEALPDVWDKAEDDEGRYNVALNGYDCANLLRAALADTPGGTE